MQCVTTNSIDGKIVLSYRGVVAAEVIFGVDFLRDFVASLTDSLGGRSGTYEKQFEGARQAALDAISRKAETLGANAILSIRFDYQVLGERNGMLMVAASGTAVQLAKSDVEKQKDQKLARDETAAYFVNIGTTERGPFSVVQLRELFAAGRLDENSRLRIDGREETRLVSEILN